MQFPYLVNAIQAHAEQLTDELMAQVRASPRTRYLHGLSDDAFRARVLDLYANLARWIGERREGDVERTYMQLGRTRQREGVSASELFAALAMAKSHLLEFILRNDLIETPLDMYQQQELLRMIGGFFESAVYHALRGHEYATMEGPKHQVAS